MDEVERAQTRLLTLEREKVFHRMFFNVMFEFRECPRINRRMLRPNFVIILLQGHLRSQLQTANEDTENKNR